MDGRTLSRILGTEHEPLLAQLANACSGVVVCRASPSQKATIVRMMKRFQTAQLSGTVGIMQHLYRHCMGYEFRVIVRSGSVVPGKGCRSTGSVTVSQLQGCR